MFQVGRGPRDLKAQKVLQEQLVQEEIQGVQGTQAHSLKAKKEKKEVG